MENKAIEFIRKLVENGTWFTNEVYLGHELDGDELLGEARAIINEADNYPSIPEETYEPRWLDKSTETFLDNRYGSGKGKK